jgi:NAD+ synthase
MVRDSFDPKGYIEQVVRWLREKLADSGCQGVVLGLSGGLDSAVVAGLCHKAFPERSRRIGATLPCNSNPLDEEHAKLVADTFDMPFYRLSLESPMVALTASYNAVCGTALTTIVKANMKARLRMVTLYAIANARNFLVLGTGNLDELLLGYFTKHGDGGCDLAPLAELTKGEVRTLAKTLGVPEVIIAKAPSAGLWEGQTDEGEMGFTYEQLDDFCLNRIEFGMKDPVTYHKILAKVMTSEHKRALPPAPNFLA